MRISVLKVTCKPKEGEEGAKKRPIKKFRFQAGLAADATEAAIFRNGTVRARAELGDEAHLYIVTTVQELRDGFAD